ncbi:hypothetical protein LPY66_20320 [Dehalobacter sp. DCM]|uniref:hypothetical protein n=1 Tax=Dehalobacter sp. DCM TaxID=2907827 RepID=UPI003081999F|nr:hypothetical protein LPY66_20320 [Dehalobacter sp. DCM]
MDIRSHSIRHYRVIPAMMIMIVLMLLQPTFLLTAGGIAIQHDQQEESLIPLLLDSGQTFCQEAQLKYIVWSEELDRQIAIEKILKSSGLTWHKEILCDYSGNTALKYSTQRTVTREAEKEYYKRYNTLCDMLNNSKTKVYLEERIEEVINIQEFYAHYDIKMIDMNVMPVLSSYAGYSERIPYNLQVGESRIAIQGITKSACDQAKTIIALPALFEEI